MKIKKYVNTAWSLDFMIGDSIYTYYTFELEILKISGRVCFVSMAVSGQTFEL